MGKPDSAYRLPLIIGRRNLHDILEYFSAYWRCFSSGTRIEDSPVVTGTGHVKVPFELTLVMAIRLQPFMGSRSSPAMFGAIWYKQAEKGDKVCLVLGCSRPLVLRPKGTMAGKEQMYTLVGASFFPGEDGGSDPRIDDLVAQRHLSDIYLC